MLEIGTGSGYSAAMLAELLGPAGQVVSLDVSEHLLGWANLLHHQRGITTVTCHLADGTKGYPRNGPFDRVVTWCTLPAPAGLDRPADSARADRGVPPVAAQPSTALQNRPGYLNNGS